MGKRIFLSFFLILVLCSAVIGGVFVASSFSQVISASTDSNGNDIGGDPVDNYSGKINILAMGRDVIANLTDSITIYQIDSDAKVLRSLSIPRDTRVKIKNSWQKINAAYVLSKDKELGSMQAIKGITNLPIHYYITVDTAGFRAIVDYLGGVDIEVEQDLKYSDPGQGLFVDLKKGMQHLDGNKAEQYVRVRKSKGLDGSDVGRVHRQQHFMSELIKQKLTVGNIARANDIFNEIKKYVNTNFTISEAISVANKLRKIDMSTMEQYDLSGHSQMIDNLSYYVVDQNKYNTEILPKFK